MAQNKTTAIWSDVKELRRLWPYLRKNKKLLLIAAGLIPIISLTQTSMPLLIKWIVDNGIMAKDESVLLWGCLAGLGLIIIEYIVRAVQTLSAAKSVHQMIQGMRDHLVAHIMKLSARFHDRNLSGALTTRATSDFDNLSEALNMGVLNSIVDISVLIGAIIGLLLLNWQLALCALMILPIVVLIVTRASKILKQTMLAARVKIAALNGFTQECLYGSTTIKLLTAENHAEAHFDKLSTDYRNAQMKSVVIDATLFALLDGISSITIGIILWFAVTQIYGENSLLTVGIMIAFIQYIQNLFEPLKQLGNKIAMLQGAFTSLDRIFGILDQKDFIEGDNNISSLNHDIKVDHLNFSYHKDGQMILNDISFELKTGQSLALVGRTGSGKSTIIKLISKLYDRYEGSIHFGDKDLRTIDGESLRRSLAIVPQSIVLFEGSILFNITLDLPGLDRKSAEEAAKLVGLHNYVNSLPDGYNHIINEDGGNLSQGQKQLVVFARALVKKPDLIILDEATSSVDPASERLIQSAINRMMKGRTVIIIAHRLSTIQSCDNIIYLSYGKIIEQGSHQSLIQKGGSYYELYHAKNE